ncbi:two-partner secretion domain-containing protein [Methylomusa anaerophila]|uniref:Hemolysin n=1 Tax=Methylomusa anaerophila TaxID=1930071 RepID=A0A348AF44_9FIRM|nr:hemagglutinin repeat-containing protein [Methylomusa anaerophila]BBB89692.1 hemolysin precursor [Methylomusa anaerophila]
MLNPKRPGHTSAFGCQSLKKWLIWLTAILQLCQPTLAGASAIVDKSAPGSNRPYVEFTANGLPVVQITTPSAAGVSRNIFRQFDVFSQGLILNNSRDIINTQLAGYIAGNPFLLKGSARIILSEVSGPQASHLNGYTEIAGQKAEFILANPNGIFVNGAGFINTSHATLTTGAPVFGGDGSLSAFRVSGGQISIDGAGLNGGDTDRVDLISRAVTANAGIWANELNVVTGTNEVQYDTLYTDKISAASNKPAVAIDVGALGGMYANKIYLVGTEQGVGVNSQGIISAITGDLTVTGEGKVTLAGNTTAGENIYISAQGGLDTQDLVYAAKSVNLTTPAGLTNAGLIAAGEHTTLTAAAVDSTGTIGAGINSDGTIAPNGDINITTTGSTKAGGQNTAAGNLTIRAAAVDLSGANTYAGQNINLTARTGDIANTGGTIQAMGSLNAKANGTLNNDQNPIGTKGQLQADQITITAGSVSNMGGVISQTGTKTTLITAQGTINNSQGEIGTHGDKLTIEAAELNNTTGKIIHAGGQELTIRTSGDTINTSGQIGANGANLTIEAQNLINTKGSIVHAGAQNLTLKTAGDTLNTGGQIDTNGQLTLTAQNLDNSSGQINSQKDMDIRLGSGLINETGVIRGGSAVKIAAADTVHNRRGTIEAGQGLNIRARSLQNENGRVANLDSGLLTITVRQDINNQGGQIGSNGKAELTANTVNNQSGTLTAQNNLTIRVGEKLDSNEASTIAAGGDLAINSGGVINLAGSTTANQNITLTAQGDIHNQGTVYAGRDATLAAQGALTNTGTLAAQNNITINVGERLDSNEASTIAAGGALAINSGGVINLAGATTANQNITLAAQGDINNQGTVYAGQDAAIGAGGALTNTGAITAGGNTGITANTVSSSGTLGAGVTREGKLGGSGNLTVAAQDTLTATGQNLAAGNMLLQGTAINLTGAVNQAGGSAALRATTGDITHTGASLDVGDKLDISAAKTFNNDKNAGGTAGQIQAGQVTITAANIANRGGSILQIGSEEAAITAAHTLDNSGGKIAANGAAKIKVGELINQGGSIQTSGLDNNNLVLDARGSINNSLYNGQAGIISAGGSTTITADSLNNSQGQITAGQTLSATVTQDITNTQGLLAANQNAAVSAGRIHNTQGTIAAVQGQADVTAATGILDNTAGRVEAQKETRIFAIGLNNTEGVILGGSLDVNTNNQRTDNTRGSIAAAAGPATIRSGIFINEAGLVQAAGDLTLDTGGQTLANTNSGATGGIIGRGSVNLLTGSLTNQAGYIYGENTLTVKSADINNSQGGLLTSAGAMDITAASLNNQGGQIQAGQVTITAADIANRGGSILQTGSEEAAITAAHTLDNSGGKIAANGAAKIKVGELINQGGSIQTSGLDNNNLVLDARGSINNSLYNGQAGIISAGGSTTITADSLNNSQGQITAGQTLSATVTQDITNTQGLLAANQNVAVSAGRIHNTQGTIAAVQGQADVTATTGILDNTAGRVEAQKETRIFAIGLNNTEGVILGGSLDVNTNNQRTDNTRGSIAAAGPATIRSGIFINEAGLVQAAGDLILDTGGQTLANTNSGATGGIIGRGSVNLLTGSLTNQAGYIYGENTLTVKSADINNSQGGLLTSAGAMDITAASLNNQGGQIQALGNVGIQLGGTFRNAQSLVRAGQTLTIRAAAIDNTNTQETNQGIEGRSVNLTAAQIDNSQGAIRANETLTLTGSGQINNSQGLVSAGKTLTLQDANLDNKTLQINNSGGTLIAGQQLNINSAGLTGDGKIVSQGDLTIKLTQDYTHTGELEANGDLKLETAGAFTNKTALQAGNSLTVIAGSIDNTVDGQISGKNTAVAADTLTNRGLIDGGTTLIEAGTLNNLGTGRIYGDQLAIEANTLTNDVENGTAPAIAARNRLDIGAQTLVNREHALIYSDGDMAVGGSLAADKTATGQAAVVNNNSATIEARGNLSLFSHEINNTNEHFSTVIEKTQEQQMEEYQGSGSPNRYLAGTPGVYIYNDESDHLQTPAGGFESWLAYRYTRTTMESKVETSDPGQILSGGAMQIIADTVTNDKSKIIAGGTISGSIGALNNIGFEGQRITTDSGTVTSYWRNHRRGRDDTGSSSTGYNPPDVIQNITLAEGEYQENAAPSLDSAKPGDRSSGSVQQTAAGANPAGVATNGGAAVTAGVTAVAAGATAGTAVVTPGGAAVLPGVQVTTPTGKIIRTGGVNIQLANNSLFTINKNPNNNFLFGVDPQFANNQQWLSSEYLLNNLSFQRGDPPPRLGDGFYEQKMIQQQVTQLTGRRFLKDFTNDQDQYQALLNNALAYAQDHQLTVGTPLTEDQMAELTSDLVWLVEKDVILPDGQTTRALVPQLYVCALKEGDLAASGALLSGYDVKLNLSGDLTNSGGIAGNNLVALTAENIRNLGGSIRGNNLDLQARTDLDNIGGRLEAVSSLTAQAGRDLNLVTTTTAAANDNGSRTVIDRIAGLYVTGSNGLLLASAQRNVNLTAAEINNSGTDSQTTLAAGQDLNLGTVGQSGSNRLVWDGNNRRSDSFSSETGTTIQTQGSTELQAGNDLNARAAYLDSQGPLTLTAGRDVNLTAGQSSDNVEENHQHKGTSGFFSSTTYTTHDQVQETLSQGTTLSADSISVQTGRDINISGSNVAATHDVTLQAGNDITLTAAQQTSQEEHMRQQKTSGLFSSGGLGFTIGSKSEKTTLDQQTMEQAGSTIGSIDGNVNLIAGNQVNSAGTTIISGQDTNISGKNVTIDNTVNTYDSQYKYEFKQSGLSVSLGGGVIDAATGAYNDIQRSGQVQDDRLKTLYEYKAVKDLEKLKDFKGNLTKGVGVGVSIGSSQMSAEQTTHAETVNPSNINAGGNVNITATDGDINLIATNIHAIDVLLDAKQNLNLDAAQNQQQIDGKTSSSSWSLGASFGLDGNFTGLTGGFGSGHGTENGNTVTHTGSVIDAAGTVTLKSGNDTNIIGSQVKGDKVVADIGGNLNLASTQDSDDYTANNQSTGIGFGTGKISGTTGSFNTGKTNSNYDSVTGQAGIFAGAEGFDIYVGKNTDLKGAVISSEATPDKNKLSTDTLTYSDIENKAEYSASSKGIGYAAGKDANGNDVEKKDLGLTPNLGVSASGDASSTTQSAISPGTIEVRSNPNQDLSGLSRDPAGALNALDQIFDKKTVQEKQELAQLFGEVAYKAIGDLALSQYKKAASDLANATPETDAYNEALARRDAWAPGGANEIALHALAGGIMSDLGGNSFGSGAVGAGVSEAIHGQLQNLSPDLQQWASAIIGAAASEIAGGSGQTGASTAVSGIVNNGLMHDQQMKMYSDLSNAIVKAQNTGNTEDIVKAILDWSTVNTNNNRNPNNSGLGEAADKDADTINILNAAAQQLGIDFNYNEGGSLSDNLASFRQAMIPSNPDNVPTISTGTLLAGAATAVVAGVTLYYVAGNWYKAAATGTVTGTVWDKITPIASNLPGTAIPATFQLQTAQRVLYVNSNATKHMAENINRFGAESWTAEIRSQAMLSSFNSAVQQGMANLATSAPGRYFINVGGWELGINTETGVIYHALYK